MTQEDKELLLKDLCARLNTNLVCSIYRTDDQGIGYRNEILYGYCNIDGWNEFYFGEDCGISIDDVSKIKPYLFPLSSMTEEQKVIYGDLCYSIIQSLAKNMQSELNELINWLNAHHFDYRGLIEKGLAIDATNLNVY